MRKLLPVVAITLLAVASFSAARTATNAKSSFKPAATDQTIIDNSKATWEAYKSRNVAAIKALTAKEYVSYTLAGPSNLQQDIDTIAKLNIESYTIDEPKVTWVTKDVAILRYKCDLKGSYEGKEFGPVYATEVWVNRTGKWSIISYQETPRS